MICTFNKFLLFYSLIRLWDGWNSHCAVDMHFKKRSWEIRARESMKSLNFFFLECERPLSLELGRCFYTRPVSTTAFHSLELWIGWSGVGVGTFAKRYERNEWLWWSIPISERWMHMNWIFSPETVSEPINWNSNSFLNKLEWFEWIHHLKSFPLYFYSLKRWFIYLETELGRLYS